VNLGGAKRADAHCCGCVRLGTSKALRVSEIPIHGRSPPESYERCWRHPERNVTRGQQGLDDLQMATEKEIQVSQATHFLKNDVGDARYGIMERGKKGGRKEGRERGREGGR
jgi:hypothetical protein